MSYISTLTSSVAKAPRTSLVKRLFQANATFRERKHLANLPETALRDIGVTHNDVAQELQKSVWDAPVHFKRN